MITLSATHQRILLSVSALASLMLASGCASARIKRQNALALAAAEARVLEGCYDCLLRARTVYELLAGAKGLKARDSILVRLFEIDLLLALREKELGLDWRPTIERAKTLVPGLPASLNAPRLLDAVDAVLPDAPGLPAEALAAMQRERAPFVARVSDEIAWIARTPLRAVVRDYLALALDCSYPSRPRSPGQPGDPPRKRPVLAPGAPPIIAYRTGICVEVDTTMLARARRAVPAFDEAAYFHGIVAALAADETGGGDAAELFAQAYRRFPRSPGVTFMSGWLASVVGDCATAVRYFDATLSIQPAHDNAMLRRTICLSKLHRDSAAIVSATQLIALETESLEQGYYWRALSRHRLKELSLARSDIGFAKARMRVASFLTLAGIIEHDQGDLAVAEQDLREARTLFRGEENCAAAWYLALVLNKSKRPGESAQTFEAAMACYEVNVSAIRGKIVRLQEKAAVNPAHTAKRIAALEADSTEQRTRYYSAAFNAAGNQANAGNVARAIQLLEIAASDPKLTDAVSKLRAAIVNLR